MRSAIAVLEEQVKHFYLIRRLSLYELKSSNYSNLLGMAWEIINPLIQIGIYWFVFGYGIRQRSPIVLENGTEIVFFQWMLSGIIVWFFFYQSTIKGSKSIYTRLKMLSKMNFPMSVIPNVIVFSQFYIHLVLLSITIIVMQISGYFLNIYYLQIIYFIFATFAFTYSLALITSTLSTIIRDVQMFLQATLRLLLYLSPILWQLSTLPEALQIIMKINPLYYIIEGYRAGFLGLGWYFIEHWDYTLYFWSLTIILFLIGSSLHLKFRKHFIDFL
ncbi:teichoic acid ABC transporter permease [Aquibacillus halophilus]|uniref:Transport permease protein n=1 Tax=Aquibacillus halophilus TaxID=930132 RepID=A0A6A8D7N7_9BACI|nr:ABC transporter permease [Aquibacillus halophilus]MRH41290.1 teichoic acid ABC transporter permease [Aquibacillus halophilus]